MSEAYQVLIERQSTKKYLADPVPEEILNKIAEAGKAAPTGMNKQSPIILVITDKDVRDRIAQENAAVMGRSGADPFYGAPAVLIVLADKSVPTYLYDGSLVMGNMLNAAEALGVGACWIHRAKEVFAGNYGKELLKSLGIEGEYEGIGNCIVGYPADKRGEPKAKKENWIYKI